MFFGGGGGSFGKGVKVFSLCGYFEMFPGGVALC